MLEEAEALELSAVSTENDAEKMTSESAPLLKLQASEAKSVQASQVTFVPQH